MFCKCKCGLGSTLRKWDFRHFILPHPCTLHVHSYHMALQRLLPVRNVLYTCTHDFANSISAFRYPFNQNLPSSFWVAQTLCLFYSPLNFQYLPLHLIHSKCSINPELKWKLHCKAPNTWQGRKAETMRG